MLGAYTISQKEVSLILFGSLFSRQKGDNIAESFELYAFLKLTVGTIMPHEGSSRESSKSFFPLVLEGGGRFANVLIHI